MIDRFLVRLREPRYGIVCFTAAVALMMSAHWRPMTLPALILVGLLAVRPAWAVRPVVMWALAASWFAAILVVPERMEDHVPLFAVWLVALAISLSRGPGFLDHIATQARLLVGVTFTAAVMWKLYFGTYLDGVTLWTLMLIDLRFEPLAAAVGLSDGEVERDRLAVAQVLSGSRSALELEAATPVVWAIVATAVMTLLLEGIIAASHLVPDRHFLARLRLPSIVVFGLVTYGVVPVLPFAAFLSVLAMVTGRWHPKVMWVFPAIVLVTLVRFLTLNA
jgi:hypothetical protein